MRGSRRERLEPGDLMIKGDVSHLWLGENWTMWTQGRFPEGQSGTLRLVEPRDLRSVTPSEDVGCEAWWIAEGWRVIRSGGQEGC